EWLEVGRGKKMANNKLPTSTNKLQEGLRTLKDEQLIKEESKYWPSITVPYTLSEGLANYPKYELDEIRKKLKLKNASQLKKAELVALLADEILENLEYYCQFWDGEIFRLLSKLAAKGGTMSAPKLFDSNIAYLRQNGFIFTGIMDNQR